MKSNSYVIDYSEFSTTNTNNGPIPIMDSRSIVVYMNSFYSKHGSILVESFVGYNFLDFSPGGKDRKHVQISGGECAVTACELPCA